MHDLPRLTVRTAAAYTALKDHLQGRRAALDDDGLGESNEADDVGDALDHLAGVPEGYPHTLTLTSSNALRALRNARDDLIGGTVIQAADLTLSDAD